MLQGRSTTNGTMNLLQTRAAVRTAVHVIGRFMGLRTNPRATNAPPTRHAPRARTVVFARVTTRVTAACMVPIARIASTKLPDTSAKSVPMTMTAKPDTSVKRQVYLETADGTARKARLLLVIPLCRRKALEPHQAQSMLCFR